MLDKVTIGSKIISGFAVLLIMAIVVGAVSVVGTTQTNKNAQLVLQKSELIASLGRQEVDHVLWANSGHCSTPGNAVTRRVTS